MSEATIALELGFIAIIISTVSSLVDFIQTYFQRKTIKNIQKVNVNLEMAVAKWEENGPFVDQLNSYFLEKNEEGTTNLQTIAKVFGSELFRSQQASIAGVISGEKRNEAAIERKFLDYARSQNPEIADLETLAETIGVDPDQLATLARVVRKYLPQGTGGGSGGGVPIGLGGR